MYFPFSKPQTGGKRSAAQPQTIYSEFPKEKWRTAGGKDPLLGRVDGFQIGPRKKERFPCITE